MTVQPLYQVKAWLVKKKEALSLKKILHEFQAKASQYSPSFMDVREPSIDKNNLYIINIQDLHYGKLSWGKETGHGDWDTKIATQVYIEAVDSLMAKAPVERIQKVLLIVGSEYVSRRYPF